jgi:soluble lytic murein transglycosylase
LISEFSEKYSLDPYLVTAVINAESNFRPDAVSHANARGLMQISVKTGKWAAGKLGMKNYGSDDLFEPETNIQIGCWYLSSLYEEFGDMDLALAAYNGGSGNVSQWLRDKSLSPDGKTLERIPFPETEQYIKKVKKNYSVYKRLYENQF